MVKVLVYYKCGVREEGGYKSPDVPDHVYSWRINRLKQEVDEETGEFTEYFEVVSEMDESELMKIKDSVDIIKVVKLG